MLITKLDGEQEEFDPLKLERSLIRAGASQDIADDIVEKVQREIVPGMTTSHIYRHARKMLKRHMDAPVAARYSLRRAVMGLGPSGFPFESLIGEIFKRKGYRVRVGVELMGKCVMHEMDVVAENPTDLILVEAKFHNQQAFKTDVKVPLYVHARFLDLEASNFDGLHKKGQNASCWIMTNTKFTEAAITYGECVGITLVSWTYPDEGNIQDMVEELGVHPLTCLTTLSQKEKTLLLEQGALLCNEVVANPRALHSIGFSNAKIDRVLEEAHKVCVPNFRDGLSIT